MRLKKSNKENERMRKKMKLRNRFKSNPRRFKIRFISTWDLIVWMIGTIGLIWRMRDSTLSTSFGVNKSHSKIQINKDRVREDHEKRRNEKVKWNCWVKTRYEKELNKLILCSREWYLQKQFVVEPRKERLWKALFQSFCHQQLSNSRNDKHKTKYGIFSFCSFAYICLYLFVFCWESVR
jgi:hypothetical protein